ncbi:hypothetical protein P6E27_004612 [Escherichia coli]|nr:hypothetical protein [Escherichia coli]EKQ7000887.1 hypothetical protein [Escherichia coli]
MEVKLAYDEITKQATETITGFMQQAKSAREMSQARLFTDAAWGATMFWRDLTHKMMVDSGYKRTLQNAIEQQDEIFQKLIDTESVSAFKDS